MPAIRQKDHLNNLEFVSCGKLHRQYNFILGGPYERV